MASGHQRRGAWAEEEEEEAYLLGFPAAGVQTLNGERLSCVPFFGDRLHGGKGGGMSGQYCRRLLQSRKKEKEKLQLEEEEPDGETLGGLKGSPLSMTWTLP